MYSPQKLTTQGTQDEEKQNKNNPEKLTTQGTQDEEKQNKNNLEKLTTQGTRDDEKQNKNKINNRICVRLHYTLVNTNKINKT